MRHGGASHVEIRLSEESDRAGAANGSGPLQRLSLVVRDDGQGFAPGAPLGLGLTAMRERVRTIDGSCRIESRPSGGTTISVSVPLHLLKDVVTDQTQATQSAL
jgi:signal transduction histidine kinase